MELLKLLKQYQVPSNISFIAQVQTLISKHHLNYDLVMSHYDTYKDKEAKLVEYLLNEHLTQVKG